MRGARAFGVLLGNEWVKARKRIAFWIALGFFAFFTFMGHSFSFFQDSGNFRLPEVWSDVFAADAQIVLIFASLTLLLLTTTEFGWRTARQNVIDGLSKSQWFWGKSLVLPIVGGAFFGLYILIPVVLASARTDFAAVDGALVPPTVLAALGGLVLAFLSVGGFGFFLSLAIRRTGAALGVWFLWIGPIEFGMIHPLARRFLPDHAGWVEYLPWSNTFPLLDFRNYDDGAYERSVAALEAAGRTPPVQVDPTSHLLMAAVWAVLFMGAAFFWFRRRDL